MTILPLCDLARQHAPLEAELLEAVRGVARRGDFILGGDVAAFEREFAGWCGVAHGVGVDSGTSALELALRALGAGPGDEVVIPALSFVATASAVAVTGARPVMADVEDATGGLDPARALERCGPRTRAVIAVHLFGHPVDVAALARAADRPVVEDACQAHGAAIGASRAGSLGSAAAFSFYPSKNLGGWGDGGMVTTGDGALAGRVAHLRNYGQTRKYEHETLALNRRLDTMQAAVLRVKLRRLDEDNARRREAVALYRAALAVTRLRLPADPSGGTHAWSLFPVRSERRDALAAHLRERGIESGVHYPRPLHLQPAFSYLGLSPGSYPNAEGWSREELSLPLFPGITPDEIGRVADAVGEFERG